VRPRMDLNISEDAIRDELGYLVDSRVFQQSERLVRFLNFTVDRVLAGRQDELKEYAIGVEVYDRRPPYHPNVDSIVRTEARRLRAKLKEYYEGEGRDRDIYIYYRLGSYAPVFRRRDTLSSLQVRRDPTAEIAARLGPRPVVAVLPLRDLTGNPRSAALAAGVTAGLAHSLATTGACRVVAATVTSHCPVVRFSRLASRFGVQFFVEGAIQDSGAELRTTFAVVNSEGLQIKSFRIHGSCPEDADLFSIEEQLADDLSRCIAEVVAQAPRPSANRPQAPQILSRTARTQQPFSEVNMSLPPN
jgi:TolB-like protein